MGLPTLGQTEIIRTFIALALLLGSAFLFGTLIEKIKGPRVVGEILGGMLIGGSGLFLIFPDFMNSIFSAYPEEGKVLNVFYQMGLIFLMFLSGFSTKIEVDRKKLEDHNPGLLWRDCPSDAGIYPVLQYVPGILHRR